MEYDPAPEPVSVQDSDPTSIVTAPGSEFAGDPLTERLRELERSVHNLRLLLYFAVAVLLIVGILAALWLFKQTVERVDELSGSFQVQIDQRTKASRLNMEEQLNEIRRQLKASGGEDLPAGKSAAKD